MTARSKGSDSTEHSGKYIYQDSMCSLFVSVTWWISICAEMCSTLYKSNLIYLKKHRNMILLYLTCLLVNSLPTMPTGNFCMILSAADFFFNISFFEKLLQEYHQSVKQF